MIQQTSLPFFTIKRKTPEASLQLLMHFAKHKNNPNTKSYNVTNDDQRYELIRRVLAKELTIKKVLHTSYYRLRNCMELTTPLRRLS